MICVEILDHRVGQAGGPRPGPPPRQGYPAETMAFCGKPVKYRGMQNRGAEGKSTVRIRMAVASGPRSANRLPTAPFYPVASVAAGPVVARHRDR